jgi:BlaI family transcriptional regulator, penicillinase repressor
VGKAHPTKGALQYKQLQRECSVMPRWPSDQPTKVELEILHLLWEHGPCALGQIHEAVSESSARTYSTTRKMIQVMRDKGLIICDESVRPQLYAAAKSKEQTQLNLLEDLVRRAFGGSAKKLVMSLLSAKRVSLDDVREMQRIIQKAKGDMK